MKTAVIIKPGIFTTIQDLGRIGMRRYGIGYAGVADVASAVNANILCGNPPGAALLECTYNGPVLKFFTETTFSVTGVDVEVKINEKIVDSATHQVTEGDVLKIRILEGCRAYIAIKGGIDVPSVQGSKATDTVSRCCGYTVRAGGILNTSQSTSIDPHSLIHPPDYHIENFDFYPGPEFHFLSEEAKADLIATDWKISPKSSRLSYMLEGKPISMGSYPMLSAPVLPGTIQLPPSGMPIILANDSQTTGGYPRVGIITPKSYQVLSQKPPGSLVKLSLLEE